MRIGAETSGHLTHHVLVRKRSCTCPSLGFVIFQKENHSIVFRRTRWLDRKIADSTEEERGVSEAAIQAAPRCPSASLKRHSEVHTGEMRRSTRNSNMDALLKIAQCWMTQQLIRVYFWSTNTCTLPFEFIIISCQRGHGVNRFSLDYLSLYHTLSRWDENPFHF